MKGRVNHEHRLRPPALSGTAIEERAIHDAESGKSAEGNAVARIRRRAGGRVEGRKADRRVDKRARRKH